MPPRDHRAEFEVRLAKEAATTATMATNLAAHHLVEDVGAHSDELLAAPKNGAPARAGARRATALCLPVERVRQCTTRPSTARRSPFASSPTTCCVKAGR